MRVPAGLRSAGRSACLLQRRSCCSAYAWSSATPVVRRARRQDLGTIEVLSGAARLVSPSERAEPTWFQIGDRIREGDGVDTTSGGLVALRLASGASVRVDRGTRVRLLSDATLALDEGTMIYIDSGVTRARPIEVRTPWASRATRHSIRSALLRFGVRVRVRDGLVRLSQSRESHDAGPGDELTLDRDGTIVRRTIPVYGADWAWAVALAHPFDLEGRSLRDFLRLDHA